MIIELSTNERLQFQYLLPVQGDLQTLELVEKILQKVKIDNVEDINNENELEKFDFKEFEISFIRNMINFLDQKKQLNFQSLTLIRKILNIKGEK